MKKYIYILAPISQLKSMKIKYIDIDIYSFINEFTFCYRKIQIFNFWLVCTAANIEKKEKMYVSALGLTPLHPPPYCVAYHLILFQYFYHSTWSAYTPTKPPVNDRVALSLSDLSSNEMQFLLLTNLLQILLDISEHIRGKLWQVCHRLTCQALKWAFYY